MRDETHEREAERIFAEQLENGTLEVEALLRAHPEYEEELRRLCANFAHLHGTLNLVDARPDTLTPSIIGRTIGPYRVRKELGAGAQGAVLLAEDTRFERRVALRLLASVASDTDRARFRRAAELIAGIDHPNLTSISRRGSRGRCSVDRDPGRGGDVPARVAPRRTFAR